ncbi:LysR family transcriptional regulator [Pseudaquabacterium rugosum]|jgi:DNA-binding transcriptional LysR family regulator|uniref:LysR family transcriptional regulator n=1 Tax=Pseudaquabacterium rugosum TaxID=2984194 RepID=A0ABU9BCR7_9BURK
MRFNKLDLNLLVALDALLIENNITLAAKRVHLSQGAMSNALARLREYFDDELLVPVGRRMEPTARAKALAPEVRDLLVRIDNTMQVQPRFDPTLSDRTFRLAVSDYSMAVYIPHLLRIAAEEAPAVRFEFLPVNGAATDALERGTADVLVIPLRLASLDHPATALFQDRFTCMVAADHPLAGAPLSLADYQAAAHALAHPAPGLAQGASIDAGFFLSQGVQRRIEITAYAFSHLALLLPGTLRIATLQRLLVQLAMQHLPVVELVPDFEMPLVDQRMQWHRLRATDPGLIWLRDAMMRAARALPPL